MSDLDGATLTELATVRRQLRELKGLTESRPGVFTYGGMPFLEFVRDAQGMVQGQMRNANTGSAAVTRMAAANAVDARKLVDEARRRLARLTDD
jgi:hypothetical protein